MSTNAVQLRRDFHNLRPFHRVAVGAEPVQRDQFPDEATFDLYLKLRATSKAWRISHGTSEPLNVMAGRRHG